MLDALILPLGIVAVSLVVLRLAALVWSSWQQFTHNAQLQRLSLELLRGEIEEARKKGQSTALAWNGHRKFVVERKVEEAKDVCSFYLVPHDRKALPPFRPGQYLTFRLNIPGREKPVVRCYSLSGRPTPDHYRITVKRVRAPRDVPSARPGLVSNYFHEQIHEGDILDVQAPRGHFVLEPDKKRPAVLVAGGVGVTPILSMAETVVDHQTGRELIVFYGVRNRAEHAFQEELATLVRQNANLRLVVAYSRPGPDDTEREGRDYHHTGWIDIELIKSYLPSTNYEFYICGPPAMMETLTADLTRWGVAKTDLYTEAFGAATVSKAFGQAKTEPRRLHPSKVVCQVTFAKSNKQCGWDNTAENLLEFALASGIQIESGCRAGNCGTCVVAVKSGRVNYLTDHGAQLDAGTCLTCVARPDGDVVLDA